jgi:hypothetical protein
LENGVGGSHFVYIVFGCYHKMNGCGRKRVEGCCAWAGKSGGYMSGDT